MELSFLPQLPSAVGQPALFGVLLLAGLLVGELVRRFLRVPRIIGYVLAGVLLGPQVSGLLGPGVLTEARVLIDLSLGLIVFELGHRLDFQWLKRNRWLFAAAIAESALSFLAIHAALLAFGFAPLLAATAAAIGTATSPAVVLLVAHDLRAAGQVTERMLLFTAVNCTLAHVALTLLLPLRFGYGGQLFFVILFVLTGASLQFGALASPVGLAVAAFIVARFLGKGLAILVFGRLSGVRPGGAGLLSLALLPMSGLAVVMVLDTAALYPSFGGELAAVVLSAVAVLEIVGPVATQFALKRAGEADPAAGSA